MLNTTTNNLSRYIYILCAVLMCYASFFFYPRWKNAGTEAAISWDVSGYYWYLPSAFIYKDIKHQSFKDNILKKYGSTNNDFQQGMLLDNGNYVMKYASGMAVMYLPFFIVAHLVAGPLGYPTDGFSPPYQFAIQFGGLLISLIGLWYLRKLLLNFYTDKVVAIVMVLLVFGSNYLNYAAIECGMSHCWLFTVYVFLLLNTMNYYRTFKLKYAVRIGLLVGLATLTRPTDIISCLIPLLWGMDSLSFTAIKKQFTLFLKNYKGFLLAAICAACVISIQLIYWKYVSGHWLVYSYQGQKLYFRSPNFENYTLSYRSGWLTYSPMMVLAFIGIIPFLLKGKNKVAILTFFLLNYYIVCAWNIWWYGGRAMVQSYPVLLFTVAALVSAALDRKILLWILTPVVLVFLYFNIWITCIYHKGTIYDNDCMSEAYFWKVVGKWSVPLNTALLKENPDMYDSQPKQMTLIYENDFKNDSGDYFVLHPSDMLAGNIPANMALGNTAADIHWHDTYVVIAHKPKSLHLDQNHQNSPTYKFAFPGKDAKWLRAQATFHCEAKEWEGWKMAQFIVRLTDKGKIVKENMERVYRVLTDQDTKTINLDVKLPEAACDSVHILFWNGSSDKPIWIDDLKVFSFK